MQLDQSKFKLSIIRSFSSTPINIHKFESHSTKTFLSYLIKTMKKSSGNVTRTKSKIHKAFNSAKSIDQILKCFNQVEKVFPESDLAYQCTHLATQLSNQAHSLDQVISFANRALRILIHNTNNNIPCFGYTFTIPPITIGKTRSLCTRYHNSSLYIAYVCDLSASACRKLNRFDEGISYLNWAYRNLSILLRNGNDACCEGNCLVNTLLCNQKNMYNLKINMRRLDEAIVPLMKVLEIEQSVMEEGCVQLGMRNEQVCCTYVAIMNYEAALPFGLIALEIYTKCLGCKSVDVARVMSYLVVIYHDFKEYDKALEQNQMSQNILKNAAPNSHDFFIGENDTGYVLIGLGRYEEAIDVLKRAVSCTEMDDSVRGLAFVNMAKAVYYLGKRAEAKKHMKTAQKLLEKKETIPSCVAVGFRELSVLYENMNDFRNATSLLKRYLSIPNIAQKRLAEGSARLFSLICLSGKEKEGIAYMEDVVEILKHSFGSEHCEVGYAYRNLGAAYLKSGQEELAVKFMMKAKDIMDVKLGSHHVDSLKTSQMLAETYATMRRYDTAIEIPGKVVGSLKVLEPCEQELLNIAVELLNKMKESVTKSCMGDSLQSKDDDDLPVEILNCSISDDEKLRK